MTLIEDFRDYANQPKKHWAKIVLRDVAYLGLFIGT
jgi:hypothetical protein